MINSPSIFQNKHFLNIHHPTETSEMAIRKSCRKIPMFKTLHLDLWWTRIASDPWVLFVL